MRNKILLIFSASAALTATSCNFLEEDPKTFLSPDTYFTTEAQMKAAVDGLYPFLDDIFDGDVEVGTQRFVFLEYMAGYGERKRAATSLYMDQAKLLTVTEENTNVEGLWKSAYTAIENCNVAISGMEASTAVTEDAKSYLLGQAYFMRAYHYFNLVRLWGEVPLKITPTTDITNTAIPLTSIQGVYDQVVSDLTRAEELMENQAWNSNDGHVAKSAVKSLLAKVYMTMAGYPLQLGNEYYNLAYNKAKEVYDNAGISLYSTYADMRTANYACGGEVILTIEREADNASSPVHSALLPYPEVSNISQNSAYGGAIAPTLAFYNSYGDGDLRKVDFGYYTMNYNALDGSGALVPVDVPYIYKYWDESAANNAGKSAMSYPLIRYADVLLLMAEAKVMADGGTTTDPTAIEAYRMVRTRAFPDESAPASLDFSTVYKERIWELCFETQTWYDMLRTRKALNTTTGQVVDLIGYRAPGHESAFEEEDLLFPYPLREKRLNPNLVRN